MAKTSQVNRNGMREYKVKRDKSKRSALKAIVMDRTLPVEDRFNATLKLAQLPRNGSAVRVRLRCELTGRSRGNYRKFKLCRIKLREGMTIGAKVTLRKDRMYEFLDRLITIALPRVRDFRGITGKGFDGRGNFAMGMKEQIIFPEINYDRVDQVRGMDIQFVTTAKTDAEAKALLKAFDLPFAN